MISDCGKSRGYGFVHFTDEDDFRNCLEEMNEKLLNNKKINVKKKLLYQELIINIIILILCLLCHIVN